MRLLFASTLAIAAASTLVTPSEAATASDPVQAILIAAADAAIPGQPVTVGIFLKLQPGWHVYWKYSGDAGLPTQVKWNLPAGWTAGPIQWPLPHRFIEKGPMTTYGYADSVLLIAELTPPTSASGVVPLKAKVDWMVCEEFCIPGNAEVVLDLPIERSGNAGGAASGHAPRFAAWETMLPDSNGSRQLSVSSTITPHEDEKNAARVMIAIDRQPSSSIELIDWFPAAARNFAVKELDIKRQNGGLVVSFVLKSFAGPIKSGEMFESTVTYRDTNGQTRGLTVSLPITPA